MNLDPFRALAAGWREEAAQFARRGYGREARMAESVASDLEQRLREWELQELTIPEASLESGYSEDHLRRLVRDEVLPDQRPPGSEGEIRMPLEPLRDERDRAIDDPSLPRPGRTSGDSSDRSG